MSYEWDERKNASNLQKHGVSFEEAQTTWIDLRGIEIFDSIHSVTEDRFLRIAHSIVGRLLLTSFVEQSDGSVIRIISSREATKQEREVYEERI
ncbi:MAG: BrnT family toxin [Bdellovibrio sp.]|nr:BrnT family toxin [Bdellovibrio sp.]